MTMNILDRQVLSLVAPVVRDELGWTNTQYGTAVFCFLLGMTVGQVPVGRLMDRAGARRGFVLILGWWSVANALHAFARSVAQFGALRFLMGLGECGVYSGGVKAIGEWFPQRERTLAAGLFNAGSLVGAILAPPLIVMLMRRYGWPAAFLLPSVLGLLWVVPWIRVYPRAAAMESAAPGQTGVPLRRLLGIPAVWGVILMRTFGGPVTHFYWYWLPEYLKRERGMTMEMIGAAAFLPFLSGGVGNIGGGWFSSWLIRRGWTVDAARRTAFSGASALALTAVLVPACPTAGAALFLICVASTGINALAANLMGLMTDLFPRHSLARVSGLTGFGDSGMSMVVMYLTGVVVDRFSYAPVFAGAGLFPLISLAAFWFLVREVRPVALEAGSSATGAGT